MYFPNHCKRSFYIDHWLPRLHMSKRGGTNKIEKDAGLQRGSWLAACRVGRGWASTPISSPRQDVRVIQLTMRYSAYKRVHIIVKCEM